MSWDITITHPSLPDVQEPIIGMSACAGNMYMSVIEMKGKQLREMSREEAIESLKDLITEIDKGNDGKFTDAYAVNADKQWSKGNETKKEWKKYCSHLNFMPFKTYEEYCGWELRKRVRETSVRFLLYYIAGYQIQYDW